ncbi:hypothetical protein FACS1894145_1660 [Bacteroidia bacterium]|nr:hypothetical protein FACS1894145_1660 [Bacteroidia bacterium]
MLVIDPGHGGKAAGATGKRGKEKDINLAVSKLLKQYISEEHPDVKIIMTRTRDVNVGLDERANIANKANANLFISIHANAVAKNSKLNGCEVYTFGLSRSEENLEVAKRENSVILLEDNYKQKYEGFDPNSSESYIIFEFMQNRFVEQSVSFATMVQKQLVETAHREDLGVKQAENFQPFRVIFLIEFHHVGVFFSTGTAPGRPEINQLQFPFNFVQGDGSPFRSRKREIGSDLSNLNSL